MIFLFFICISLSGVVAGLFETGFVVFENADDGARPARRLRLQQPASCSPVRHIRLDHFVILKISCRKAPRISTCPAFHRLEPSRRPAWTKAAALLLLSLEPCGTVDGSCADSTKPKNSSGLARQAERFSDGISKKYSIVMDQAHALPASAVSDDETGPRSTRDDERPGHTRLDRKSIERPVSRWRRARTASPSNYAAKARFAGAKNHIRNINRRQNLFDIS
ncbi:hypothetical protein G3N96_21220 [Burkholderia sp. Se-20373]|uniref:hypothetical protein n=1 Tax=Burkholderia sp. Se-20373 TaxID=2703898 RepID=UPI00197CE52A|nr:hypothetical protein [Burkholderia sp. Se-20373]MBN3747928.1 hypothetical protein [Burkholderia sp. Se-20373]